MRRDHRPLCLLQANNDLLADRIMARQIGRRRTRWEQRDLAQLEIPELDSSQLGKCVLECVILPGGIKLSLTTDVGGDSLILVTEGGDRLECTSAEDLEAGLGVDAAEAAQLWEACVKQPAT